MVKENWFKRYDPNELPDRFDQIIQSWDTANKPTELSDYSVCTTWGMKENRFYLLHVLRRRMDYPSLKRAVQEQAQAFGPTVILIEDKASGTQLIQELVEAGVHAATRFKPEGDKLMRLHAQTGTMENGFVYLPREAHWLAEYLHELTTFPNGKHDDQVDSTSQALGWAKQRKSGWGILEYYRQLAEQSHKERSDVMIRLKVPPGASHIYTITGRAILVPADRIIEVNEHEGKPLLALGYDRL